MKKMIILTCLGLLLISGTAVAQAQGDSGEIEALRKLVQEQNARISDLLSRIEALEAKQGEQGEWIETEKESEKKEAEWTERIVLKGDFRYRYEWIDDDREKEDRNRNRIRARVGLEAKLNDTTDLGFQLSTSEPNGRGAEGDPISNNQTLTNSFSLKNIWLSQAYFDWHPAQAPGLHVLGGKVYYPFYAPGKSELIWDADLTPEGGVIKYAKSFDSVDAFGNLYGFWVLERSQDADSGLFGAQGGAKLNFEAFGDKAYVLGGLGYFDFGNVEGERPFFDNTGKSFGNTLVGNVLAEDFDELELFGEFGFKAKEIPLLLFAHYVTNVAANGEDDGWLVGLGVGKAKEPGDWEAKYTYRVLQRDAVLGGFTNSDFGRGGTDAKGHEIGIAYQLAKNWQVVAKYFNNETGIGIGEDEEDYEKVQLDLNFKF
ncbi:putative porin [Candidatus Poribacteria bacterium]|nr:putative porin [Candidatus Poribacteria bacterium]